MHDLDPEMLSKKRHLQMDILMKDSDVKKMDRKKIEIEVQIRELKRNEVQIQTELLAKEKELKKISDERSQLDMELIKLKHQMNNFATSNNN